MSAQRTYRVGHLHAVKLIFAWHHGKHVCFFDLRGSFPFDSANKLFADGRLFVNVASYGNRVRTKRASGKRDINAFNFARSKPLVRLKPVKQHAGLPAHFVNIHNAAITHAIDNRHFVIAHNRSIAMPFPAYACHHTGNMGTGYFQCDNILFVFHILKIY